MDRDLINKLTEDHMIILSDIQLKECIKIDDCFQTLGVLNTLMCFRWLRKHGLIQNVIDNVGRFRFTDEGKKAWTARKLIDIGWPAIVKIISDL